MPKPGSPRLEREPAGNFRSEHEFSRSVQRAIDDRSGAERILRREALAQNVAGSSRTRKYNPRPRDLARDLRRVTEQNHPHRDTAEIESLIRIRNRIAPIR